MMIFSPSYAKINLGLAILNKRDDGFHNIFSLFSLISLHDNIQIIEPNNSQKENIKISMESELPKYFHQQIIHDFSNDIQNNLLYKAYYWFYEVFLPKETKKPLKINIIKKIPSPAGLGGGSSNAAFLLLYLLKQYQNKYKITRRALLNKSIELGSDIPFFIQKKCAIIYQKGEILECLPSLNKICGFLLLPNIGFSTNVVYKNLNSALQNITKKKYSLYFWRNEVYQLYTMLNEPSQKPLKNMFLNRVSDFVYQLKNDLLYSCEVIYKNEINRMYSIMQEIIEYIQTLGIKNNIFYSMSGSGSCFYIIIPKLSYKVQEGFRNNIQRNFSEINCLLF